MNPIRALLLSMAGSRTWRRALTRMAVTRRVVARFIPGEKLGDAVAAVQALNAGGMEASLNPLGENVQDVAEATAATAVYLQILDRIAAERLRCHVSVKLTMLGLDLGGEMAHDNLRRVLERARDHGIFVRIDMESSAYVDRTLALWRRLHDEYSEVGLVLQTYLLRTPADVEALVPLDPSLRIVKGAYAEPPDQAFPDKRDVDRAFVELLDRLARDDARGCRVAIASHDPAILEHGRRLIDEHRLDRWEFQMLFGIGKQHQAALAAAGYRVRVYVSYGPSWYPWFMRRLAERPANLWFFLRHLTG